MPSAQSTVVSNSRYSHFNFDSYTLPPTFYSQIALITLQTSSISQRLLRNTCRTIVCFLNWRRFLGPGNCQKKGCLDISFFFFSWMSFSPPPLRNFNTNIWGALVLWQTMHLETVPCLGRTWPLIKMKLIQKMWAWAWVSAFLTGSQMLLMMLVHGPHFELWDPRLCHASLQPQDGYRAWVYACFFEQINECQISKGKSPVDVI